MVDNMHSTGYILTTRYLDRESNLVVSAGQLSPSGGDVRRIMLPSILLGNATGTYHIAHEMRIIFAVDFAYALLC